MQIRLNWVNTRRRKIISIFIDFWMSILLYNYTYFFDFNSYPNQVVSISIGFFWVIFSYILGRYKKEKSISLKSLLISILKVFSLIIFGVFIYAFVIFHKCSSNKGMSSHLNGVFNRFNSKALA